MFRRSFGSEPNGQLLARDEFAQTTRHTLLNTPAEHLHALIVLNARLEDLFRRIEFHSGQNDPKRA